MTTRERSTFRHIVLSLMLITAGCNSECNPTKKTTPGSAPVQLTGTARYLDPPQGQLDPHAGKQKKFEVGALQAVDTGVGPPQVPTLSRARTGLNAVMAVYPAIENVTVNGKGNYPAGWETKNREVYAAVGDYMKGAFYAHAGVLNFVPVWPQVPATSVNKDTSQVFMRVISFTPEANAQQPEVEKMPGAQPARKAAPAGLSKTRIEVKPVELKARPVPQIRKP